MKTLYSLIQPFKTEYLSVSNMHSLYLEQSGNPKGIPVIVLHGGPGAQSKPDHRRFFDPKKYRIIIYDQRGCGKSKPSGELQENTTSELISDIEKIKMHLNIDTWMVFGGSWGSTLGLLYAEAFPDSVTHMIFRGIFLCRKWEIDWLFQTDHLKVIFPDIWEQYMGLAPPEKQSNLLNAYKEMLLGKDEILKTRAFRILTLLEDARQRMVSLIDSPEKINSQMTDLDRESYKILFYYIENIMFLKENQILNSVDKIRHIPTVILHGRYDLVCPLQSAWELHKAFPEAEFHILPATSHKATEPLMIDKLIEYTNRFSR